MQYGRGEPPHGMCGRSSVQLTSFDFVRDFFMEEVKEVIRVDEHVVTSPEFAANCPATASTKLACSEMRNSASITAQSNLRQPQIIHYDTARYPFRDRIIECMGIHVPHGEDGGAILEALRPPSEPTTESYRACKSTGPGNRGPSTLYIQQWCHRSKQQHRAFGEVYLRFLREVVLPNIGDADGILFQRIPTFRTHVSGGGAPTGRPHKDSDYGHQRNEINYWLPITRTFGTNSLYAESAPGKRDFEPFELRYGECQRFWGSQCQHYTRANDTDATRVSIDFRIVPRSQHQADDTPPDGLQWKCHGARRPADGIELHHEGLSTALAANRRDFNPSQWKRLGVPGPLTHAHYIMADGLCYKPTPPRFTIGGFYGWLDARGREVSGVADEDDEEDEEEVPTLF